jgi:site-specific recombinase XerD
VRKTVHSLISPYLQDRKLRKELCAQRVRDTRSALTGFATHCGGRPIENISVQVVESWLAKQSELAPATIRGRLSTVRTFFRWCIRRGHCRRNPAAETRGPRQPRAVPRALPHPSIAALLAACPDARGRLMVLLMVQQGLRCCEISRLSFGDVDRINMTLRIEGKGHHERILPLLEPVAEAIDCYLAEYPAHAGPLVRSYRKCARRLEPDSISKLVAGWCWDAGIKLAARDGVSAHAGRHTCATDMLRQGAHVRDVQQAMGHAHIATTEIYLPLVVHGLAAAMGGRTY